MLGVLPGLVGCVQALETIKIILGVGKPLIGRMVYFDTLSMELRIHKLRKDPQLPGVRRASDGHRADRLRGVLRPARPGTRGRCASVEPPSGAACRHVLGAPGDRGTCAWSSNSGRARVPCDDRPGVSA